MIKKLAGIIEGLLVIIALFYSLRGETLVALHSIVAAIYIRLLRKDMV